jgi:hypothetical protein
MWLLLFLMFFQGNPTPCQSAATPPPTGSPIVIVQTVDPGYLPINGATVTVTALGGKKQSFTARTEDGGYARFFFPAESGISVGLGYSIEVKMPNFKTARVNQLVLRSPTESPYVPNVQFVMKLTGKAVVVD